MPKTLAQMTRHYGELERYSKETRSGTVVLEDSGEKIPISLDQFEGNKHFLDQDIEGGLVVCQFSTLKNGEVVESRQLKSWKFAS